MEAYLTYPDTNRILADKHDLFALVSRPDIGDLLRQLDYDWGTGALNAKSELFTILNGQGFVSDHQMTRFGRLFLARLLLNFDPKFVPIYHLGNLNDKYHDFKLVHAGKNSIVLSATHVFLGARFILKLVRPGASGDLMASIKKLNSIEENSGVVAPIDFILVDALDLLGKPVKISCIVFPYVKGITFRNFLNQRNHHLNSQVVIAFISQIAPALAKLESINAYHGDLHEQNILVDQYSEDGIDFKIIDVSYDAMGSLPFEICKNNDILNFKQHVWRILSIQRQFSPEISLRKYIGTRNYLKILRILSEETRTFVDIVRILHDESEYLAYADEKSKFISRSFDRPSSFRLQRYEEITDQTIAVKLFVPFDELMGKIRNFSNVYVAGNRGSGKSTYLASLAFFPEGGDSIVNFQEIFGVYFPCRQGEFRPLAPREGWAALDAHRATSHVLVVKIIRRTLEIIAAGLAHGRFSHPHDCGNLRAFINLFVPAPGLVSVDRNIQTDIENFVSTMIRVEMEEIGKLATLADDHENFSDGTTLLNFFSILRDTFDELAVTRFHLLFDDAGTPYVPENVQRLICDLILMSNSIFCVKLSAEKLTFQFESSSRKALENGQDYFEHDISQVLFIGSGTHGLNRAALERYFRRIVEQRLVAFNYVSRDIVDYIGNDQIGIDELMNLLARGRKDAYYCGWSTVWNIADRTPRNLLEIVSEIFAVGGIGSDTVPRIVSRRDQDRAIRTISDKRLESLSHIAGAITLNGKTVSLGRHLFETTSVIGSTFRKYLRAEEGKQRKRQHLAIERNELGDLAPEAEEVLRRLITFGIVDSGNLAMARDDEIKKPFYVLNRIYCPAFSIGYRRDDHLRLSQGKLEMLLLRPGLFMREGTRRLRESRDESLRDLFSDGRNS